MNVIVSIFEIKDYYNGEECSLGIGTLERVTEVFEGWLHNHILEGEWDNEESFYEEYPDVKRFVENEDEWFDNFDGSIYSGWELHSIGDIEITIK